MSEASDRPSAERGRTGRRRRERASRGLLLRRALGFAIALLIVLPLAFNGGGYDVVVRHQIALAIWAAIAFGLAVGVLPRARLTPACWVVLGGFAALAALTLLAFAWTESDERTTEELARVLGYAGIVTLAYLSLNRYTWRGAATGFAVAALVVPFFAVGARLFPDLLTDQLASIYGTDRLSYPFDYWNAVACWGAMAIAIGLTVSANAKRIGTRAAALACVPVAGLSVYLTYSRFGVAAVAIAMIAAIALGRNRWTTIANAIVAGAATGIAILVAHGQDEIARATGDAGAGSVALALIGVGIGCALVAALTASAGLDRARMQPGAARLATGAGAIGVLLVAVALNGPIGDAWREFKEDKPPPARGGTERLTSFGSTRYDVWSTAVDAFESEPLRGVGPGSFEYYWSRHGESGEFVRDAHSLYIEEAAELGLPGVVLLLITLLGLLWAAIAARVRWSRRREIGVGAGLIAAFLVFLAYAGIDWMWEVGAVGALALGGAAVAGAGGLERAQARPMGHWVRAAAVVLALVAGASQVPGLVATERTRASEAALADGDLERARDLADQAVQAEPWAGSPYAAEALVSEKAGDLSTAIQQVRDAIDHDPNNWRQHLLLARLEAGRGDRAGVRAQLREVERLAPNSPYLNPLGRYRQQLDALLAANERRGAR